MDITIAIEQFQMLINFSTLLHYKAITFLLPSKRMQPLLKLQNIFRCLPQCHIVATLGTFYNRIEENNTISRVKYSTQHIHILNVKIMTYLCFMAHGPCTTNLNILVPKSEHRGCLMYKCFETGLYFYPSLFQYDLWAGWRWQSRTCARAEAAWQFITASDSCPTAGGTYETRPGSGERSVYLLYL